MATIKGYVKAVGTHLENNEGPILLKGWGIGNWLLQEGYMWLSDGNPRLDRPRRIKQVVAELTGESFAEKFWQEFQENYFTLEDALYLKKQGYNSIRLPLHWDLFLKNEPEISFKEEGFALLEKVITWCREADLYLILDLHGAPGGQTGDNIDDSIDNLPRLFLDEEQFAKGIALWEEIARRFSKEEVIAAYDLLNEPVKPGYESAQEAFFVARLEDFYEKTIAAIRKWDPQHLISLEGHHWATNPLIFNRHYDDNYLIHFHRYATFPEKAAFEEFLELKEQWQVPLWLGETGENLLPWFSGMTQICDEEEISYHFWPYKKLGKTNGPVTIETPKDWDLLLDYTKGGIHPGYQKAQEILTDFLTKMKFENCQRNEAVDGVVLRNRPFELRATEFLTSSKEDHQANTQFEFHKDQEVSLVEVLPPVEKRFAFDINWDRFGVKLTTGDVLTYGTPNYQPKKVSLFYEAGAGEISLQGISYKTAGKGVIHHDYQANKDFVLEQISGEEILVKFDFL